MRQLEQLVMEFQQAVAERRQDDQSTLYKRIRRACLRIARALQNDFDHLDVEEFVDEKLADCLEKFTCGNFAAYFRQAMNHRCLDEIRRKRASKERVSLQESKLDLDNQAEAPQERYQAEAVQEALENYAIRKRHLIDQLQFGSLDRLTTLLIDQRQRASEKMAKILTDELAQAPSAVIVQLERWHSHEENYRLHKSAQITLRRLWSAFADNLDASPSESTVQDLVRVIQQVGLPAMSWSSWRQRICRYFRELRDQLDESEIRFFHASPR